MAMIKRGKRVVLGVLWLLLISGAIYGQGVSPEVLKKGRLEYKDGIYYLFLQGTPYEMGYQNGSLMKDQIQFVYDSYLTKSVINDWIKQYFLFHTNPKAVKDPYGFLLEKAKIMEKFIPEYLLEEMRGLADGAGLTYEQALIMSTHLDFFGTLSCSGFAASGPATADGKLYSGRNLDWGNGFEEDTDKLVTIVTYKPDNGNAFVSMAYPGLVGVLTAMNDKKLTVELNVSNTDDSTIEGLPIMLLLRDLIQNSGALDEAVNKLKAAPHTGGFNILVTDGGDGMGEVVELSASKTGLIPMADNVVFTTNHFESPELKGANNKSPFGAPEDTVQRYNRLSELMKLYRVKIDPGIAKQIMHDGGIRTSYTIYTVIFEPGNLTFWFWGRIMGAGEFVKLRLPDLLNMSENN